MQVWDELWCFLLNSPAFSSPLAGMNADLLAVKVRRCRCVAHSWIFIVKGAPLGAQTYASAISGH